MSLRSSVILKSTCYLVSVKIRRDFVLRNNMTRKIYAVKTINAYVITILKKLCSFFFREKVITLFSLTDFQAFPVLENVITKFQDFPGFPGPVRTLRITLLIQSFHTPFQSLQNITMILDSTLGSPKCLELHSQPLDFNFFWRSILPIKRLNEKFVFRNPLD